MPYQKKSGVLYSESCLICQFVLNVPCKGSWCTVDLCPAWPMWNHVEQRPAPLHLGHSSPSSQATTDSVYLQLWRGMDLDGAHPGSSRAAQSVLCSYGIVYASIVIYFSFNDTGTWNTPQMVYLCSIDYYYLLGWLTTPWNKQLRHVFITFSWLPSRTPSHCMNFTVAKAEKFNTCQRKWRISYMQG